MRGEKPNNERKLTAGTREQNFEQYKYWVPIGSYSANDYTRSTNVVKGILKGLDENGKVEFNYPEPGFFEDSNDICTVTVKKQGWFGPNDVQETRFLRKVYKDLKLGFEQKGDTYTLKNVKDQMVIYLPPKEQIFIRWMAIGSSAMKIPKQHIIISLECGTMFRLRSEIM